MPHKLPFRVVHFTCQDDKFPATELNRHSPATRGWISSRFCSFPQQLIFEVQERAHLRKIQILSHQYLIASKVEFFVGDVRDNDIRHYQNARYIRLGYVSLSDNQSTEFKARELKSVHVDATGTYIQILLHRNYANEHNLYNQVGLVAVNLIGDVADAPPSGINEMAHGINIHDRPDFIPATEDLAFDIYQDPEVANIIRRLEKQKQVFVFQEQFDQAQKIRDAIGYLHKIGERLGRLALEKQQAVEDENYERAKLKKFQISELRTNLYKDLDLISLLSQNPERVEPSGDGPPQFVPHDYGEMGSQDRRTDPLRFPSLQQSSVKTSSLTQSTIETGRARSSSPNRRPSSCSPDRRRALYPVADPDDRPLPALSRPSANAPPRPSLIGIAKHEEDPNEDETTLHDQPSVVSSEHTQWPPPGHSRPRQSYHQPPIVPDDDDASEAFDGDEWTMNDEVPPHAVADLQRDPRPSNAGDLTETGLPSKPEPLSESNRRLASVAIDVVGIELVTFAFSKVWAFREKALLELEKRVTSTQSAVPQQQPLPTPADLDPRGELRAITFLMKRALDDQVLSVFRLAVYFIKPLVIDFVERHSIPRAELHYSLDKLLPVLFRRTGDTAARIREVAKKQVLDMAQWPQLRQNSTFWNEVVRPFPTVALDRLALSRMELVTELYAANGVEPSPSFPSSEVAGLAPQNGFTLEAVAMFTAQALTHRSNEVREAAENLMVALYRAENRAIIRQCLPSPDDVKTQRHPLYRRLFAKFERIDLKYAPVDDSTDQRIPDPAKKQRDLNSLQAEVQQVRAMIHAGSGARARQNPVPAASVGRSRASKSEPPKQPRRAPAPGRAPASKTAATNAAADRSPGRRPASRPKGSTRPECVDESEDAQPLSAGGQLTSEAELLLSLDKTCIFCGERNDVFTEEGLDLHYWKDCPMLHRCVNCKQVVEIAGMVEHLLHECEAVPPGHYVRCPRCTEAVLQSEVDAHACIPTTAVGGPSSTSAGHIRCPLCHTDLPVPPATAGGTIAPGGPEDVWKLHLLGGEHPGQPPACSRNPRRPVRSTPPAPVELTKPKRLSVPPSPRSSPRVARSSPPIKGGPPTRDVKATVPQKSGIPRPTYPTHVRPV